MKIKITPSQGFIGVLLLIIFMAWLVLKCIPDFIAFNQDNVDLASEKIEMTFNIKTKQLLWIICDGGSEVAY